jgi:hypothetical protein
MLEHTVTFNDLFETKHPWEAGPGILSAIIQHVQGKAVTLCRGIDPHELDASLPEMPYVKGGDGLVSICSLIPSDVWNQFVGCCTDALGYRKKDIDRVSDYVLNNVNSDEVICRANIMLAGYENERVIRNDPEDPELWKILAHRLGFHWKFLPWRTVHVQSKLEGVGYDTSDT